MFYFILYFLIKLNEKLWYCKCAKYIGKYITSMCCWLVGRDGKDMRDKSSCEAHMTVGWVSLEGTTPSTLIDLLL